ncbi:hypothetical protein [Lacrimispora sp.]|uniref:hypothetical protein n=1 Tax=Lacrimispora sp. TaxID=2719234 RepID=UPI0028B1F88C|nr:hypothetical protein [Lacrimispora sp.]
MNYKDYTNPETGERTINGVYVGIRHGGALRDALAPDSDGYDHLRKINRSGSMLQDSAADKNVTSNE